MKRRYNSGRTKPIYVPIVLAEEITSILIKIDQTKDPIKTAESLAQLLDVIVTPDKKKKK